MRVLSLETTGWRLWPEGQSSAQGLSSVLQARTSSDGTQVTWTNPKKSRGGQWLDLRRDLVRLGRLRPELAPSLFLEWWRLQPDLTRSPTLIVAPLGYFPELARSLKLEILRQRLGQPTFLLDDLCRVAALYDQEPQLEQFWIPRGKSSWLEVSRADQTLTLVCHTPRPGVCLEANENCLAEGARRLARWAKEGGPQIRLRMQPSLHLSQGRDAIAVHPEPGPFAYKLEGASECDLSWGLGPDGSERGFLQTLSLEEGKPLMLRAHGQKWRLESPEGQVQASLRPPCLAV